MAQLRIKSVSEIQVASDGREYFTVVLSGGLGSKDRTKVVMQNFKRDKHGNRTDEKIWDRGTKSEFEAAMKAGQTIEGSIVTRNVEPYFLPANPETKLTTYTTVLFADENEVTVFANAGHRIMTEHGELLGTERKKAVIATEQAISNSKVTA
jgi:hypothetical protein